MGLFNWLKNSSDGILSYSPGGKMLNIRITYDKQKDLFHYHGRYGVSAKFMGKDIAHLENKEVSRTHKVLLVQGAKTCLATFDVLPNLVCDNLVAWIESYGKVAYDFDEQKRGNWHNMAEPLGPAPHTLTENQSVTISVVDVTPEPVACLENDVTVEDTSANPLEQIKQLKELLDLEAITKEEFEAKKSELLKKI